MSDVFYGSWNTANHAVATADTYGTHTGVSLGSTTSTTTGMLPTANRNAGCPAATFTPTGGDTVKPPTASITVKLSSSSKSSGDNLTFGTLTCSENLGGPLVCNNATIPGWYWNVEVSAVVNDDASKWTVTQNIDSKRAKGYYKDSQHVLHAFDTGVTSVPCPPCDGPDAPYLQRTAG